MILCNPTNQKLTVIKNLVHHSRHFSVYELYILVAAKMGSYLICGHPSL